MFFPPDIYPSHPLPPTPPPLLEGGAEAGTRDVNFNNTPPRLSPASFLKLECQQLQPGVVLSRVRVTSPTLSQTGMSTAAARRRVVTGPCSRVLNPCHKPTVYNISSTLHASPFSVLVGDVRSLACCETPVPCPCGVGVL
jgi:hypothetical protein